MTRQALTYLPVFCVFVLAILGTLFKSTKVDKNDKVVPWKYGLPALTPAGKTIIVFLTLSFTISLYTTWRNARADKAEKDNLSDTLNSVQKQNKDLTKQLDRASQPITDLLVSFEATVPMEDPLLSSYKNRLDAAINEFQRDRNLLKPLPKYDISFEGVAQIGKTSPLLPRRDGKEIEAFYLLNSICLTAFFNKNPLNIEQMTMRLGPADFQFTVCPDFGQSGQTPDDAETGMNLLYETSTKRLDIVVTDTPAQAKNLLRGDAINSIPDLLGAQLVLYLEPASPLEVDDKVFRPINLYSFQIKMSGGRVFRCNQLRRVELVRPISPMIYNHPNPKNFPVYMCAFPDKT